MLDTLLEKLSDLFIQNGGGNYDNSNYMDMLHGHNGFGIDLSDYSHDEIMDAIKSAMVSDGFTTHSMPGHEISFGASPDVDERNLAKSDLLKKLDSKYIRTTHLYTDNLWGGLDDYSGDKVYDAINDARNSGQISDSEYKDLIASLKKACHTQ